MKKIIPVIMCGGAGTRMWPSSRETMPKQFIPLLGKLSTFQDTLLRLDPEIFDEPAIVTNHDYRFLVQEQMAEIGVKGDIVLEPERRDSAAAVAVACELASARAADAVVAVFAADHDVRKVDVFKDLCRKAADAAAQGFIVTLGIKPTGPGHRLWLYPSRAGRRRRGGRGQGRSLCRKAGPRHRRALYRARLFVELRQFLLPRRCDARRIAGLRTGNRQGRGRRLRQGQAGPRLSGARRRGVRQGAENLDRLRGHGADLPCGGDPGRYRLVGRRQLAGGLGAFGSRRQGQFRARPRRGDGAAGTSMCAPTTP